MRPDLRERVAAFLRGEDTSDAVPAQPLDLALMRVIEVGSLNINGEFRDLFAGCDHYTGIDMVAGPGVDVVGVAHEVLVNMWAAVEIAVYIDTAEHDPHFHRTLLAVGQSLLPGGYLLIGVPGVGFPMHERPDYWRFLHDAHEAMMEMAECDVVRFHPLSSGWFAVGRRREDATE